MNHKTTQIKIKKKLTYIHLFSKQAKFKFEFMLDYEWDKLKRNNMFVNKFMSIKVDLSIYIYILESYIFKYRYVKKYS